MFGHKKIREQIQHLDDVHCALIEEIATENKKTRGSIEAIKEEILALHKQVAELSKKTITQTTQEADKPLTYTQLVDEWINGTEDNNG
jgi:dimeric dUTPase (all-alpha-NTP-PPase superfamily)